MMSLGKGAMQIKPSNQKLNIQSSAEVEIFGIGNHMSGIFWIMRFLEAQGCLIKENIIYQDNQSAMII